MINAREMPAIVGVLRWAWRMGQSLTMSARLEITKKHAKASKKAKGVMLDQLVATTGWSRANARRAGEVFGRSGSSAAVPPRVPERQPEGEPSRTPPSCPEDALAQCE